MEERYVVVILNGEGQFEEGWRTDFLPCKTLKQAKRVAETSLVEKEILTLDYAESIVIVRVVVEGLEPCRKLWTNESTENDIVTERCLEAWKNGEFTFVERWL
jgi:hypothetical protein